MKNINKIVLLSAFASSLLLSSEIALDSIGLNLGKSHASYSQENHIGSITLGNEPDKTFSSYELYTVLKSVYTNKTIKPYISYTYSSNTDLKHQYVLVGLNKYYKHNTLDLYAGVLAGYGQLDWRYNPLNSSKDNTYNAYSFIGGIQAGIEYPLENNLALNINAKYLYHDYETKLEPSASARSTLTHDYTASFGVGLSYKF